MDRPDPTDPTKSPRRASPRGFTLIELMVVILILGLLIGLVGPRVWHALKSGSIDTANMQMKNFAGAIEVYYLENRSIPNTLEELTQPSKKTNEPYLDKVPLDPWNQPYDYKPNNAAKKDFQISCSGEDKVFGTEDDLYYPERTK